MVNEKKPSIYVDRGTIGSSDELDEYGVWVKGEPQDLSPAGNEALKNAAAAADTDDFDLAIPEIEELPDFGIPAEEEPADNTGLDDFYLPTAEESADSGAEFPAEETADDEDFLSDIDLETDLFVSGENGGETFGFADPGEQTDPELPDLESLDSGETFEEPELLSGEPEPAADDADSQTVATESFGLDLAEEADDDFSADEEFTEVPMDDFIGSLAPEQESSAEIPEVLPSLSDDDTQKESAEQTPETKSVSAAQDLSTQLLVKIADELASIRAELSTLKKEFTGLKAAAPQPETKEDDFFNGEDDEKIALTGDELNNILNTADFTEESGADAAALLSEDLNVREPEENILPAGDDTAENDEDETLSIRDIETGLDELEGETEPESSGGESAGAGDFDFSPDEIVPEGGEPDKTDDFEISLDEITGLEEFPEAENGGIFPDDEDGEIITVEEENPDAMPDFTAEENEELKQLRENGAEPMAFAPAPEDADFLTEDPLSAEPVNGETSAEELPEELSMDMSPESIDLSDAVIDEPDLSGEIQESPLEEPSPEDISISLDLDETPFTGTEEFGEEEIIDLESPEEEIEIPGDLSGEDEELPEFLQAEDAGADNAEGRDLSLIPEGFVVEAGNSQSFLETNEEEILHEEDLDILEEETSGIIEENTAPDETVLESPLPSEESPGAIPSQLKHELKTVLSYMDQLLESLPDDKIEEFARSEHFDTYKKLFKELGLV